MVKNEIGPNMQMSAHFDRTGRYRFSLHRRWSDELQAATMVMLNPSTADHLRNDPTINRCIQLSRAWGFGSLNIVNLFAYRTNSPAHLRSIQRPVGKENDTHIMKQCLKAGKVIIAWGNHGSFRGRDKEVLNLLSTFDLWCIGQTKLGQPKHPLYVPAGVKLQRFQLVEP
ncbi:MAG TPA: DUF1643 domain-containing protein [Oculatellaceae cyanobacterium]